MEEAVRAELRRRSLQLWLPPYSPLHGCVDTNGAAAMALNGLARDLAVDLRMDQVAACAILEDLRQRAVSKLRAQKRLTLIGKFAGNEITQDVRLEVYVDETGSQVLERLRHTLSTPTLKIISNGRLLHDGNASLEAQGWLGDHTRGGKPLRVLLLRPSVAGLDVRNSSAPAASFQSSVALVRDAAERLTAEGFGDFELSDASTGRLVPVPPLARQSLVTAIALHARGRDILGEVPAATCAGEVEKSAGVALEFLLEASQCFSRCGELGIERLLEKLQNFGALQLDVCWAYALLGDVEYLPDAETRLEIAERMIQRQVDRNFLTLAEVYAEQGKTLPPEVVPSVRLWLLRGIARRFRGDISGARNDLERAALFLRFLHVDEDAIAQLLVLGASRVQAVAALRRNQGSVERAAADWLAAAPLKEAARRRREKESKLGQTDNGSFVDADKVAQFVKLGFEQGCIVKALKKSNNDIGEALMELQRGARKRSHPSAEVVDNFALAQLVSLGYGEAEAEAALRSAGGGGVEAALQSLTQSATASTAKPCFVAAMDDASIGEPASSDATVRDVEGSAGQLAASSGEAIEDAAAKAREEQREKAKAEEEQRKKKELDDAREVIERELGRCLRRVDLDDDLAGASLAEEEALVLKYLSGL